MCRRQHHWRHWSTTTSRRWRRSETLPTMTTADSYSRTSSCWTAAARSPPSTSRCCRTAAAVAAGRIGRWPSNAFGRRAAAVTNWTCTDGSGTRTSSSDNYSTFIRYKCVTKNEFIDTFGGLRTWIIYSGIQTSGKHFSCLILGRVIIRVVGMGVKKLCHNSRKSDTWQYRVRLMIFFGYLLNNLASPPPPKKKNVELYYGAYYIK